MLVLYQKLPLSKKITVLLFCTTWFVMLATTLAFVGLDAKSFRDEEVKSNRALAKIIAHNIDDPVARGDSAAAGVELADLSNDPHVISVWIVRQNRQILASFVRRDNVGANGILRHYYQDGHAWAYYAALLQESPPLDFGIQARHSLKTVMNSSTRSGVPYTIVLYSDGDELRTRIKTLLVLVLLVVAAACGGGYVIARRLQRFITDPVSSLVDCMERVKREQVYSHRAHCENCDELGQLVEGFNQMLQQMELHEQQMLNSREQLATYARRLLDMEEALRKDLAGELHDEIGRDLAALNINHAIISGRLPEKVRSENRQLLDDAQDIISAISRSIRHLMGELRPSVLDDYGLAAALHEQIPVLGEKFGCRMELVVAPDCPRLPPYVEIALYRIAQEAIVNAAKHGNPRRIAVSLAKEAAGVRLVVEDDGKGFDPAAAQRMEKDHGWGITIMRERAEAIGGKFSLVAAPGSGTVVTVLLEENRSC
jgi:signal transduction histidine kinase